MTRFGGIASSVIPANAGIQTWQPLRPLPLDSRFRGNDTGKSVIGSALKQHALAEGWARVRPNRKYSSSKMLQRNGISSNDFERRLGRRSWDFGSFKARTRPKPLLPLRPSGQGPGIQGHPDARYQERASVLLDSRDRAERLSGLPLSDNR